MGNVRLLENARSGSARIGRRHGAAEEALPGSGAIDARCAVGAERDRSFDFHGGHSGQRRQTTAGRGWLTRSRCCSYSAQTRQKRESDSEIGLGHDTVNVLHDGRRGGL